MLTSDFDDAVEEIIDALIQLEKPTHDDLHRLKARTPPNTAFGTYHATLKSSPQDYTSFSQSLCVDDKPIRPVNWNRAKKKRHCLIHVVHKK
jgi:hypothetical protein